MKKHVFTLFALIFFAGTSCQEKIDIEKEKEAIKDVIEKSSQAWLDRDFESMASTWVHDESVARLAREELVMDILRAGKNRKHAIRHSLKIIPNQA